MAIVFEGLKEQIVSQHHAIQLLSVAVKNELGSSYETQIEALLTAMSENTGSKVNFVQDVAKNLRNMHCLSSNSADIFKQKYGRQRGPRPTSPTGGRIRPHPRSGAVVASRTLPQSLPKRTQSRTHSTMKHLTSTELRSNLAAAMDQVNDDHEPVMITRAGGKTLVAK